MRSRRHGAVLRCGRGSRPRNGLASPSDWRGCSPTAAIPRADFDHPNCPPDFFWILHLCAENVRSEVRSLRQLPFANSRRRANGDEIPLAFKGVWPDRPNLRDWRSADFRSLNGFRLFPSEPRRIWFGQRKRNVSSRLPIRVDRTFHRSSAARHSIRDTRSGRGAVCRCARLRMRQSLNGASARHC